MKTRSWAIAKMTARCALYIGALKKIGESLTPRLLLPKFLMDLGPKLLFRSMSTNVKIAALRVPEIIGDSPWMRPRSLFFQIIKGLLFTWTLWIHLPNLKIEALCVPEIIGGTEKIAKSVDRPALPFLPNFKGLLLGWILWIYLPNLKFVALRVPEIIGGTRKIGKSLDTPTLPFLSNF